MTTTTPFGPQLIGETEKALGALLDRFLAGTGLVEREWVTLRVAAQAGAADADALAATLAERAHFTEAPALVQGLTARGLLAGGRLTAAGRELTDTVQARVTGGTAAVWDGLPEDDVAATTRLLHEIVARARTVLAGPA